MPVEITKDDVVEALGRYIKYGGTTGHYHFAGSSCAIGHLSRVIEARLGVPFGTDQTEESLREIHPTLAGSVISTNDGEGTQAALLMLLTEVGP